MPSTPSHSPAPPPTLRSRREGLCARLGRWGAVTLALLAAAVAQAAAPKEYEVKAAFLFNFTKFVEWPATSFSSPSDPIVIAVLGRNPFGDDLANLVKDRTVDGRRIVVQAIATPAEARAAGIIHVLFVPTGEESRFAELAEMQPRRGMLTVGESGRFSALGGMIDFVVAESRVRFEINRAATEAAGLKLRAQLQKLAAPRGAGGGSPP